LTFVSEIHLESLHKASSNTRKEPGQRIYLIAWLCCTVL